MTEDNAARLDGKVAIITGAAGGVGRATVELFLQRGAYVVAEDIDPAVAQLARDREDRVAAVVGDVRHSATAENAVATALERFSRLDVLVNNAAVILSKDILATSEEEWDEVMDVNVKGVYHHCRAVLPRFGAEGGSIVNVTSISGVLGLPQQAAYCASKGAVVQMTRQLAVEYAERRVRVNSVAPGAIDTPFLARHLQAQPDPAAAARAVDAAHPLGRAATPREIAETIAFFASDASSFVTGAIMAVDGGYTAR